MHRIMILPDIQPAGYPANLKAGYRISSLIFSSKLEKCEVPVNI
jgi:hypothetical protein